MTFKRIEDFNDAELLALTDEQVQTIIDYECALEGVPLLPKEPVKPAFEKPKPNMEVYTISTSVYFTNAIQVAEIVNLMNRADKVGQGSDYKASMDYAQDEINSYYAPKFETKVIYSNEQYRNHKDEMEVFKTADNTYQAEKKEYDKGIEGRKETIKAVNDRITEASNREYEWNKYKNLFARYLTLAKEDKVVAWNFLKQAYWQVEELEGFKDAMGVPEPDPDPDHA